MNINNNEFIIVKLTIENMNKYLPQLIALDRRYSSLTSGIYSREIWGNENFLMNLEGKWDNSWCVVCDSKMVGFAILSRKEKDTMHINRLAVDKRIDDYGQASELLMSAIGGGTG